MSEGLICEQCGDRARVTKFVNGELHSCSKCDRIVFVEKTNSVPDDRPPIRIKKQVLEPQYVPYGGIPYGAWER